MQIGPTFTGLETTTRLSNGVGDWCHVLKTAPSRIYSFTQPKCLNHKELDLDQEKIVGMLENQKWNLDILKSQSFGLFGLSWTSKWTRPQSGPDPGEANLSPKKARNVRKTLIFQPWHNQEHVLTSPAAPISGMDPWASGCDRQYLIPQLSIAKFSKMASVFSRLVQGI